MQHIRKYRPELLSLISELWSSLSLQNGTRPPRGFPVMFVLLICGLSWLLLNVMHFITYYMSGQVLHLVEQLCLALNDEFRTYLPDILPYCIQVLSDAERCNDYKFVLDILHTFEVFGGQYYHKLSIFIRWIHQGRKSLLCPSLAT